MQSVVDLLHENEKECLIAGDNEYAGLSAFARCRLGFHAGEELSTVDKDCLFAASRMVRCF